MSRGLQVLIYHQNSEFVDRYERLIRQAREDLQLLVCKDKQQIEEVVDRADIIFAGHTFPIEYIPKAKNLKWVQSMGAGVENYTRAKAIKPPVILTKVRGMFGPIMSEYVVAYILALTQRMREVFANQSKKRWAPFFTESIEAKTVGVMGLGSVGATIAYRIHRMGAEVIALEEQERRLPYIKKEYPPTEIDEFLGRADFVVVTLPLTNTTHGILGEKEFAMMKKSAYLINVSRGPLVQERALLKALGERQIAGAVLDVFDEEPLPADHPFWELDNVIVSPHISGPSLPEAIAEVFIENLKRFEKGKTLEGVVNLEREY